MKNVFSALLLLFVITFTAPVQAQSSFNFDDNLQMLTTGRVPEGVVVNIRTYLSIRSEPSVFSAEKARISNGTRLGIDGNSTINGFYKVFCWWGNSFVWGYAHSDYIAFTGGYFNLP